MTKPLHLRKLWSAMAMADIDLRTVARRAKVDYSRASEILNGRRIDPVRLAALVRVIEAESRKEALA